MIKKIVFAGSFILVGLIIYVAMGSSPSKKEPSESGGDKIIQNETTSLQGAENSERKRVEKDVLPIEVPAPSEAVVDTPDLPSYIDLMKDIKPLILKEPDESDTDFLLRLLDELAIDEEGKVSFTISDFMLQCAGMEQLSASVVAQEGELIEQGLGYDNSVLVVDDQHSAIDKCQGYNSYTEGLGWLEYAEISETKGNLAAKQMLVETPHPRYQALSPQKLEEHLTKNSERLSDLQKSCYPEAFRLVMEGGSLGGMHLWSKNPQDSNEIIEDKYEAGLLYLKYFEHSISDFGSKLRHQMRNVKRAEATMSAGEIQGHAQRVNEFHKMHCEF